MSVQVPLLKVELKRASALELIASRPELAGAPLMRAWGTSSREPLACGVIRRFPDKGVLMQQGEAGRSLFFVLSGAVRLVARRDTDSAELGVAHPGDVLGEGEVLAKENTRRSSAIAQGQTEVLELPHASLLINGKLPAGLVALFRDVEKRRMKALDEMSDFLNRW